MSPVNTPLFQCAVRTTAQWEMAMVYCLPRKLTPKAFSTGKHREKFPIFSCFFFLFFSRVSKITPTVVAADVAAAISPCAAITTRSQMKAPQMQFAVTFALSTSQAGICRNSLLHAIFRATDEMRAQIHKCEYQFTRF